MRLPRALTTWANGIWLRLPRATLAAGAAHGARMGVNLLIIKMIAAVFGPAGLGAIGNLLSAVTVIVVFAGGGITNGIAKYVAEHHDRPRATLRLFETAFALGFTVSAVVFAATLLAARPIAAALFHDSELWWLSPILGAAHFAGFLGNATIAVVNGKRRPDLFAAITLSGYLGCIPAAWLLINLFAFEGAALALMLMAGCTGVPAFWFLLRDPVRRLVRLRFHRPELRQLLGFSMMTLASALTFPVAETIIRSAVTDSLGLAPAGMWQASIRLSSAILGFYGIYLLTALMPHLSAMRDPREAIRNVQRLLLNVGGGFIPVALAIFLLREQVVLLLFSSKFEPLEPLLGWQLTGDFFRVCAYTVGILVMAEARTRLYVVTELVQYGLYVGISLGIIRAGGELRDVIVGYVLSYAIYFALMMSGLFLYRWRVA